MRARLTRGTTATRDDGVAVGLASSPLLHASSHYARPQRRRRRRWRLLGLSTMTLKGILFYSVFVLVVLGVPVYLVARLTPFFVFDNLRCRAGERVGRRDGVVAALSDGYAAYFSDAPLYPSAAYNRSLWWGTYEPSRLFALKTRASQPTMLGVAWYDRAGRHPVRHLTYAVHNKVYGRRTVHKRGADAEVMRVRWVVHDGIHYGKELVDDTANKASFTFEFLKRPRGDAWHVRVHANVESAVAIDFVLYLVNADGDERVRVRAPDVANDGRWRPVLTSRYVGVSGAREAFALRVSDDHTPRHGSAPWRVYGMHVDVDDAFAVAHAPAVGGTVAERAAADGKGVFAAHGERAMPQTRLDLRDLPHSAFAYLETVSADDFQQPPPSPSQQPHNLIVMKKAYDTNFRLELSLRPTRNDDEDDESTASNNDDDNDDDNDDNDDGGDDLSTCQLTNLFRGRDKAIHRHARKVVRPWLNVLNTSKGHLHLLATQLVSEAFGSTSFDTGHYQHADAAVDASWDERGAAVEVWDDDGGAVHTAAHRSSAVALTASRTDEPVGQAFVTGLQLLFLVRWNKEMVKDTLASWLLGAQDRASGFVPARTTFSGVTRGLVPRQHRYEHLTFAAPPTLLLGLHELLNEMARKQRRIATADKRKLRNTPEYYARERAADLDYLRALLPALRRWRRWFDRTQCASRAAGDDVVNCSARPTLEQRPAQPPTARSRGVDDDAQHNNDNTTTLLDDGLLAYRWRGRDGDRLPTSGMDDYPRPVCAGQHRGEAHVDLFAWVAFLSNLITRIEVDFLGEPASVRVDWEAYLRAAHWDSAAQRYADRVGCASRDFSPYVGYVNLYPVLLGIVRRDMAAVRHTLALARRELLTEHGLMSVSYDSVRRAREAGLTHDNVWMGYVWPSTNLMLLYMLKSTYMQLRDDDDNGGTGDTAAVAREAAALYAEVRQRLARTMHRASRWWEFYSPLNGRGEGSKTYIGSHALLLGILDGFN